MIRGHHDWDFHHPDCDNEKFEEDPLNAIVAALDPIKGER